MMNIGEIYNTANKLYLRKKSIDKLMVIVRNNIDHSFFLSNNKPLLSISPVITGKSGNKQLVQIFKSIGLYNMVLDGYDEIAKTWSFMAFSNRSKLLKTVVNKYGYSKPITFSEAIIIALVHFKNIIENIKHEETEHIKFMLSETELEPTKDIMQNLTKLDKLMAK